MSEEHKHHITPYSLYGKILVILLTLTAVTVAVTWVDVKSWNIAVALLIASVKGTLVLTYFMHLKFDNLLFKILVTAVIILFAVFILLTFFDYWWR